MNSATKTLMIAGLAGVFGLPALAQDDAASITCEEFMAMDSDSQSAAMESMEMAAMEAEGEMAESEEMAESDAASDSEDSDRAMAMESMMVACEEDPSMMAMDAMGHDG